MANLEMLQRLQQAMREELDNAPADAILDPALSLLRRSNARGAPMSFGAACVATALQRLVDTLGALVTLEDQRDYAVGDPPDRLRLASPVSPAEAGRVAAALLRHFGALYSGDVADIANAFQRAAHDAHDQDMLDCSRPVD